MTEKTINTVNTSGRQGWYVTIMLSLLSALTAACVSQFSATLAPVAERLGTTKEVVAFMDAIKSFFTVAAMMTAPYCIKRFGERFTFVAACILFLVPQVWMPYTENYALFVVLKCTQGLSVLLFPLALVMIISRCPPRNAGLATSVLTGCTYAGGAVGGTVAGICLSFWGWQSSFHALSISTLLVGLVFLCTFPAPLAAMQETKEKAQGAYGFVVKNKLTWLLIFAYLPTVWTVQAIWSDMIPFGQHLGFSDSQLGSVMSVSALAILAGSLLSGKTSDWAASGGLNKLRRRVTVFSAGTVLIFFGIAVLLSTDLDPSDTGAFNVIAFVLSFGAAWGLGSFYGIFPEHFQSGDEIAAANGFIGGCADMAMPLSPMFIAVVGIGMNRWQEAWLSCVVIGLAGLVFSVAILRQNYGGAGKRKPV